MMVLHTDEGHVLRVGFGSNGDKSEKYTAFLSLFVTKPPGTSPLDFFYLHFLRIQNGTEMVRGTSIYPDSCLTDFLEL